ncbi:MAG TPA: tetratricopeptide repeat protein [Longimicrobiales bacterium]|nr:tetratricopeptide repeat protein [Longimicrobiales bacterium]
MMRSCAIFVVTIATVCATAAPAHAQRSAADRAAHDQLMSELARLRQAASYEAAGDYAEAEEIVAQVLEANPTSLSGLLTMERVLTAQGRTEEIMTSVDRLLAADPKSVIGHQTRLRVLSGLGDVERLEAAIDDWIAATPELETPYREAAVVWRNRGDHARAVALLEQGRARIDRADALALELGDAYAGMNDMERAADEWSRAVGEAGRGLMLVERRLQMLPDGGAHVIPALVARLSAEPSTFARQRAAAMLAIEAGLEDAALGALRSLTASTPPAERQALLVELARRADAADLHPVALAAYQGLLAAAPDAPATLAIRSRIAELALLAGDTALAAATYRELESASDAGSPQHRQALALRIQLGARDGDLESALADYASFRSSFPDAPEMDATAAAVGTAVLEAGRMVDAQNVLDGVRGVASAQVRGRLALRNGDLATARHEFISAAPLLRGREATAAIALATLLTRVSARGGELVAQVMAAEDDGRAGAVRDAAAAARVLAAPERAAVLDFLADAADGAGLNEDAAAIRREIVETLPDTHEAPAALLSLARAAGAAPETTEEARVLLERLVVEYPRSALAPQARAELQRLQSR